MVSAVAKTTNISLAQSASNSNANGNNLPNPPPNQTSLPIGQTKPANTSSSSTTQNAIPPSTINTPASQPTSPTTSNNAQGIQDQLASQNTATKEPIGFDKFIKYVQEHWKEVLAGIAGIVLLVWGGIALSKRPKETGETKSSNTDNSQSNSQKSTDSNPNSIPTNASERERIILDAMRYGNEEMSCHTMAPLNALRAYYKLKGEPIPDWMNAPDGGKLEAFRVVRDKDPELSQILPDNGHTPRGTDKIPRIILNNLRISFEEYKVLTPLVLNDGGRLKLLDINSLISALEELNKGKIGILGMSERGGHFVTCYGFRQGKDKNVFFKNIVNHISIEYEGKSQFELVDNNAQLVQEIQNSDIGEIKIYDQRSGTHEWLSLSKLLSNNKDFAITILN